MSLEEAKRRFLVNSKVKVNRSVTERHLRRVGTVTKVCRELGYVVIKVRLDEWLNAAPITFAPEELTPL